MLYKLKKTITVLFVIIIFSYLSYLMLKICLSYFPWTGENDFLTLKQDLVTTQPWRFAFQIHVITSCFCLLAGFTQFFHHFRQGQYRYIHRIVGYLYIISILLLALPSGFILAIYALGGLPTQISLILLSLFWAISTCSALFYAIKKNWFQHRNWMIRSFALTLSALSLRTWKVILYEISPYWDWLTAIHIYQLESWLGWTINLIIAEWIIYRLKNQKSRSKI